jgi:NADP-dependent 3-hydroxy acid dehydrogenase YdfG
MSRITLTYCRENARYAQEIDQQLSRIGIPFDHLYNRDDLPGDDFAQQVQQVQDQMLFIITDNLLHNQACLQHLLPALQSHVNAKRVFFVVADGQENGQAVPTQFDRMVYALRYMNHWQNTWLDLSGRHQHSTDLSEKKNIEPALQAARAISAEMGDLLNLFRETGYYSWPALCADDYALFFKLFGIADWHAQYQRLVSATIPPAPDPGLVNVPVVSGPLTPHVVEELPPTPVAPEIDQLIEEIAREEASTPIAPLPSEQEILDTPETGAYTDQEIRQTIQDARQWIEKGRREQGLELLHLALEQHPDHPELKNALVQWQETAPPPPPVAAPVPSPAPTVPETGSDVATEAKSYELMGDMAVAKGDYLFAKYCWDRVVELMPEFPGIYKKLALMAGEHLHDYRETASLYLKKALEQQPNDAALLLAAAQEALSQNQPEAAAQWYKKAVEMDPSSRTSVTDARFLSTFEAAGKTSSAAVVETPPAAPEVPAPVQAPVSAPAAPETPAAPTTQRPIVLITGATSGIGRATAEVFARNGYRLILTGRRADRLSELKSLFETRYGVAVLMLPFDVRQQTVVENTLQNLPETWKDIDILVNNAGLAKGLAPIHEGQLEHWETMIDTNIKGLLYVTRAVSPGMVARRRGHIINIGSVAGKEAYPNGNVYCATKFAVDALTKSIRFDLHAHNIRVSQVCPGHVEETEFAINRFDGDAQRAKIYEDFEPLKASDVAEVIYFMATRPAHVNIEDVLMFGTQQASATAVSRTGRNVLNDE